MEQEPKDDNLEQKIDFSDRIKYAIIPAMLTIGAGMIPDLKKKYLNLPDDERDKYRAIFFAGTMFAGAALTIFSAYRLMEEDDKRHCRKTEERYAHLDADHERDRDD